jgi:hypothetical protein
MFSAAGAGRFGGKATPADDRKGSFGKLLLRRGGTTTCGNGAATRAGRPTGAINGGR